MPLAVHHEKCCPTDTYTLSTVHRLSAQEELSRLALEEGFTDEREPEARHVFRRRQPRPRARKSEQRTFASPTSKMRGHILWGVLDSRAQERLCA